MNSSTQDRPLPGEGGCWWNRPGRGLPANCLNLAGIGYPEDIAHSDGTDASSSSSDVTLFAVFMEVPGPADAFHDGSRRRYFDRPRTYSL